MLLNTKWYTLREIINALFIFSLITKAARLSLGDFKSR